MGAVLAHSILTENPFIYTMSAQKEVLPKNKSSLVLDNLNLNQDSLLDADDNSQDFQLRNENYELRNKCYSLEYQSQKQAMSYENMIKELKHKYSVLQRLLAEKNNMEVNVDSQKYNEVVAKCQYLSEQNEELKKEIQASIEKNRLTPNFSAGQMSEDFNALAFLQKPENLAQLEKACAAASEQELNQLREKVSKLEKENSKLRDQVDKAEVEKDLTISMITKDTEEHHNNIIRFKDKTIEDLKREHINLNLQLSQEKKMVEQLSSNQSDITQQQKNLKIMATQMREKDARIVELEENITRLQIENSKIRSEKSRLQQELRFLQSERKQAESKRKMLQQQLYQKEMEFGEEKNKWLSERRDLLKELNSMKSEREEVGNEAKTILKEREEERKKREETIKYLTSELQEGRQKEIVYQSKIENLKKEIGGLNINIEKLVEENEKYEQAAKQKNISLAQEYSQQIDDLKKELQAEKDQKIRSSIRLSEASKEQEKIEEQIKHKDQLIQILKIQKEEQSMREKQLQKIIKETNSRGEEQSKVITKLQQEIKNLKFENKQLEISNDELREKVETLTQVKTDIENMNVRLEKQRVNIQKEKGDRNRKEDNQNINFSSTPPLKMQKKVSRTFSMLSSIPMNNKVGDNGDLFELADNQLNKLVHVTSKESEDGKQTIMELICQLKAENNQLQNRIGQVENQLDKKALDLSMKEEEIKQLKNIKTGQKKEKINVEPWIEATKRTQFNAVFFENKIADLQKEISKVKSLKEKQLQGLKKDLTKQMEDKYSNELKKQSLYINELEKQANHYSARREQTHQIIASLKVQIQSLSQQKYELEKELSSTLEEYNNVLRKCKSYEDKLIEVSNERKMQDGRSSEYKKIKISYDYLREEYEKQSLMLKNANSQILKLNDVLMIKESQIKSVSSRQSKGIYLEKLPQEGDVEQQTEVDILRIWEQRRNGPSFSRI